MQSPQMQKNIERREAQLAPERGLRGWFGVAGDEWKPGGKGMPGSGNRGGGGSAWGVGEEEERAKAGVGEVEIVRYVDPSVDGMGGVEV